MANPLPEKSVAADGNGKALLSTRQALVSDPSGGATQDAEARAAINSILDILEAHGLMSDT